MKVCVVGLRGLPDVPGGIETHCENLYNRMAQEQPGLNIVVYGRTPYIGTKSYETTAGVRVQPAWALKNKYLETISNTVVALFSARMTHRPDYVHIHAIGPALLAPLARVLGMPVVMTHHGDDFRRAKWNGFTRSILRLGERLGVSNSHAVIAVSSSLAERLKADYPAHADRIIYIPNGADHILGHSLASSRDEVLNRFDLTDGEFVVSVGRLVPEKGFADLIRAHSASGSALPLVIVGGNSNSSHDRELQELAEAASGKVILTGNMSRAEVAQLLASARLFVLASHHEGLPIAALEAWAMGAPLLLSDIVPNQDLGLPANHYFPMGDIDTLAKRLAPDAAPVEPIALAEAFNWTSIAQATAKVYGLPDENEQTINA